MGYDVSHSKTFTSLLLRGSQELYRTPEELDSSIFEGSSLDLLL
jgi:hypothetical protein